MTEERPHHLQNPELLDSVVDAICDQFEAARLSNKNPRIEDYVATAGEAIGQRLVRELLLAELDLRKRNGERLDRGDYLRRFPAQAALINRALDQDGADRESTGRDEAKTDGSGCLSVRCPQCNTPVALAVDTPFTEITCRSCGNDFNLVDDRSDTKAPTAGTTIGHFVLLEKVGIGGFGSVWKAQDDELDRIVSIKIPRRGQLDAVEIEQFLREARSAAQLSHPNIVSVHEVGRDGDTVYIVSDFVHGVALSDHMEGHRFSLRETAALCSTIGEALSHAHEHGVIHRDLKPSNIMIDDRGKPHLTDFGLARRDAGEVTMTCDDQVLGTPAYMSPELARGEAHYVDRRSDVYSLGVVLFRLLTGELPFRGNVRMLIHQVIHEDAPSPRKLNGHVSQDLETICLKCLEKDPRSRYATGREVAAELDRTLSGTPILARPVSRMARVGKWCRRNPITASLTVALASAVMLGLIGMSWQLAKTRAGAERNRQLLYVSDISKIADAWESGSVGVALDLLERHVPRPGQRDLRGFEWYHLWKRCQPSLLAQTLESEPLFSVFGMAVSPNGRFLAAAGGPDKVIVWDLRTRKILHKLKGHQYVVLGVAFSPDNRVLASSGMDGRTYLWNVDTGEQAGLLVGGDWGVDFSPDGKLLAVCEEERVTVWDVSDPNRGVKQHVLTTPAGISSVAFSPDGSILACACDDGLIRLWRVASGERLDPPLKGHSAHVHAVNFSPDGETLVSSSADRTVRLWDVARRTEQKRFEGHAGAVVSAAFSPDGQTVVSGSYDGTAKLWDVGSGRLLDTIRGHELMVWSAVFGPGGQTVFTGSADGMVKRWDLATRERPPTFEGNARRARSPIAFDPSGRILAAVRRDSEVTLWDLTSGNEVATFRRHGEVITDLEFSPDGKTMASVARDEGTKLWDVETLRVLHELDGSRTLAFSPDGRVLATGGPSGSTTIQLWDVASGKLQQTLPGIGERSLNCLVFSPDGKILASGGDSRTRRTFVLWDALTGKELATPKGHLGTVDSIAFSPDGRIVCTGGFDGRIKLWNSRTWRELETRIEGRHVARVRSVAFSPDGKTLASGSQDETIRLWHVATGGRMLTLRGPQASVGSVAFSPDGKNLASSSGDGTIRLWPAATEEDLEDAGW
ncbi:MAG: WD40 repeat domain-containing serine/threonine protein kinase [Pirellulales bacterium]